VQHSDFVARYRAGRLSAHVDGSGALSIANGGLLPRRFQAAHLFWTWAWMLSFPLALAAVVWWEWWIGALVLGVGLLLPRAIKRSASQFVLEHALDDQPFYEYVTEAGVLRVTEDARS